MICDKIRTLRDTCGLSQSALAKKIGVTRSAVNAWEMGLSIPTAQYIVAMAQLFHISTDYLLGLQNSQAIYLDGLTEQEKQLLYRHVRLFHRTEYRPIVLPLPAKGWGFFWGPPAVAFLNRIAENWDFFPHFLMIAIIPLNYYISKNNMIYPEKMFSFSILFG